MLFCKKNIILNLLYLLKMYLLSTLDSKYKTFTALEW